MPQSCCWRVRHRQRSAGAKAVHQLVPARQERSWRSTARRFLKTCWRSELSDTKRAHLPGAASRPRAKSSTADGGTFFLDEVGDLPMALQAKLLRFLQERVVERLGGREEIPVDVRIVCATHQDLKELMCEGRFREDLYYRLSEIVITIPPLRERAGRRSAARARVDA